MRDETCEVCHEEAFLNNQGLCDECEAEEEDERRSRREEREEELDELTRAEREWERKTGR